MAMREEINAYKVDGRIILKHFLNKQHDLDSIHLAQDRVHY
jgi:hypothetical protein